MGIKWEAPIYHTVNNRQGKKYQIANIDGGTKNCKQLVTIQGPTEDNQNWRFMTYLRWKTAIVQDHPTEAECKAAAELAIENWLKELGLTWAL